MDNLTRIRVNASNYGTERFPPGAFYRQIGQPITVNLPDNTHITGILRRVQIIGDRTTAELTLEEPPIDPPPGSILIGGMPRATKWDPGATSS